MINRRGRAIFEREKEREREREKEEKKKDIEGSRKRWIL
jgi:hypothetical protein